MCCHPYDYCGPVYTGAARPPCAWCDRVGSILDGSPDVYVSPDSGVQPVPAASVEQISRRNRPQRQSVAKTPMNDRVLQAANGKVRLGDVPGSEQIISVTERVVDAPSDASGAQAPMLADQSTESAQSLPSNGWTARRATPQVMR